MVFIIIIYVVAQTVHNSPPGFMARFWVNMYGIFIMCVATISVSLQINRIQYLQLEIFLW
jgi:hypothetical protein